MILFSKLNPSVTQPLLWSWEARGAWVKDGQRRTRSWGATGWLPPRGPPLSPTHGGVSVLRGNEGAEFGSLQGSLGQTPEGRPATRTPMPGLGSCRHLGEELAGRWVGTCSALSPGSCLSGVGGLGLAERQISWDQEQAGGSPRGPCLCQPLGVHSCAMRMGCPHSLGCVPGLPGPTARHAWAPHGWPETLRGAPSLEAVTPHHTHSLPTACFSVWSWGRPGWGLALPAPGGPVWAQLSLVFHLHDTVRVTPALPQFSPGKDPFPDLFSGLSGPGLLHAGPV